MWMQFNSLYQKENKLEAFMSNSPLVFDTQSKR